MTVDIQRVCTDTYHLLHIHICHGSQMAERLGNRVINQLPVRFPAVPNYAVSLGKVLHPIYLWGNVPVLTVSRFG